MINLCKSTVKILPYGWTSVTRDRSLSAQFEHSVGVTANGVEIFTLSQRNGKLGVELGNAGRAEAMSTFLPKLSVIVLPFPAFSDGRGFTLARHLRTNGYTGRLRAAGHVIADQYAMARRSGFDEVEISDDLAARQPARQWLFRADWRAHDYSSRMRRA